VGTDRCGRRGAGALGVARPSVAGTVEAGKQATFDEKGSPMNEIATHNPFALAQGSGDTAAVASAAHARALVEARYVVALRRPRDMDAVRARILKECQRPSFAAVARYTKPIGRDRSKWPTGPSVRFAEAAIRAMGNVTVDATTTHDDAERRIVHVEVVDLEANVPYGIDVPVIKTIERKHTKEGDQIVGQRTNSYGEIVFILVGTDDDILNKQAALISKAIRTLALRLVPGDIIDEAMDLVMLTQRTEDAADPDAAKRKLFDAFGGLGVSPEQVKLYTGGDTLTPKGLTDLRALYAALRDGETTWREVMDGRETADKQGGDAGAGGPPPTSAKEIIGKRRASRTRPAAGPPANDDGEVDGAPVPLSLAQYLVAMAGTSDSDGALLVLDAARSTLEPGELAQLSAAYSDKWQGGES